MPHHTMIIDMDRCVGCGACVIACQEEWDLPEGVVRNWVRPLPPVSSSRSMLFTHYVGMCNHCLEATCLDACPTGATFRDEQGRIRVDQNTCIGCGYCVEACPYGARMVRGDLKIAEKCDLCAQRVDTGLEPACVTTCPAGARIFGDLDDRQSPPSRYLASHRIRRLETPEVSIRPQVAYAGKNEVIDRILEAHPPDPEKTSPPLSGLVLQKVARPGFLGLLGLAFLGQGAAFLRQLAREDEKEEVRAAAEPTLKRRDMAAVWLHWFNALVWLFEVLTGFGLLTSDRYRVTPGFFNQAMLSLFGSREAMLQLHVVVGIIWAVVLLAYATFGFKRYLAVFLRDLKMDRIDLSWLRIKLKRIFLRSREALPPQDRYNAGQKLFGLVVSIGTILVIVSGFILYCLPGDTAIVQWSIPAHFVAAAMVLVGLVVHLYMTMFVPSERPALFSMFHGRIPESYAKENNRRWWERMTSKG
jgi:formate dehydrogenase gamma subunit